MTLKKDMDKQTKKFIVFVDTSYLTHMAADEKSDWIRLLEHSKECVKNLDIEPRLEIAISEIALREYQGKMKDELIAKIARANTALNAINREKNRNELAKKLNFEIPVFPDADQIESAGSSVIDDLMSYGIKKINFEAHHNDNVVKKYFNWEPPFDIPNDVERDKENVRENRRKHIPDAWILEAAIDEKNKNTMLCLCEDDNLCSALRHYGHTTYRSSQNIYGILFPIEEPITSSKQVANEAISQVPLHGGEVDSDLNTLLSKTLFPNMREVFLRLLGYLAALNAPSHEALFKHVANKGFDLGLIKSCAIILSDPKCEFIRDTGAHYVVVNENICNEAATIVQDEIISMLDEE